MNTKSIVGVFCFLTTLISGASLFAHGENHPGPHGGYIRMPGIFHTEVIPQTSGFKILLLDINFQHPSIKNSSIKATLKYDHASFALKCSAQTDYFICPASRDLLGKAKTLEIIAVRENAQGMPALYSLPLKRSG